MPGILRLIITFAILLFSSPLFAVPDNGHFLVLNYHDILEEEERSPPFDRIAVNKKHLKQHFAWLGSWVSRPAKLPQQAPPQDPYLEYSR